MSNQVVEAVVSSGSAAAVHDPSGHRTLMGFTNVSVCKKS